VVPIVDGQVMATSDQGASGALVRGMRVSDLQAQESIRKGLVLGSLDNLDAKNDVIVGYRLLQRLNIRVGDGITLISPQGSATAFGTVPRSRTYRVAASFNIGMFEYDSNFIFMPLEAAQLYFRTGDGVGALEVKINDPDQIGRFRAPISDAAGPNVRLTDWQQVNSQYFTALQVERNVMFLILTLIILVAAFNIISSMIMLVKEKGRDIAILRTMGATRGMILRVFLIAGASVGIVGTFTGFALGVLFADNIESIRQFIQSLTGTELFAAEIYFLSQLPAKVDPREVIMVTGMGLGLSFLATIYPSWRAARLDPVEALRYE
jgi:lipoprotein-releasing system permease protein